LGCTREGNCATAAGEARPLYARAGSSSSLALPSSSFPSFRYDVVLDFGSWPFGPQGDSTQRHFAYSYTRACNLSAALMSSAAHPPRRPPSSGLWAQKSAVHFRPFGAMSSGIYIDMFFLPPPAEAASRVGWDVGHRRYASLSPSCPQKTGPTEFMQLLCLVIYSSISNECAAKANQQDAVRDARVVTNQGSGRLVARPIQAATAGHLGMSACTRGACAVPTQVYLSVLNCTVEMICNFQVSSRGVVGRAGCLTTMVVHQRQLSFLGHIGNTIVLVLSY